MEPTLAGFTAWVRSAMGITTSVLPDNSVWLTYAFGDAIDIVNKAILQASPLQYTLAVYNLGGSNLINFAQDLPGAPTIPGSTPPQPFFAAARTQWNIYGFVAGVVNATSDEGTSMSLTVPESMAKFSLSDLQQLKDPYGRTYLAIAQKYGPSAWGLS